MNTFFTSDLHFNHQNIMKFCPDPRGQFKTVEHMNEALIRNFNSVVSNQDTLYILGDVCFGRIEDGVELVKRLNGNKVLVTGNHDRKFIQHPKFLAEKKMMGITEVVPEKFITLDNIKIHMYHFPIEEWDQCHRGSFHFHGHQHNGKSQVIKHRRMDVGVDSNDLFPYSWKEIKCRLDPMPIYGHHKN